MFVCHFHLRKRLLAAGVAVLALLIVLVCTLPGCRREDSAPINAATEELRLAYLESLGWAVAPNLVETLDLRLPERLEDEWKDYAQLQTDQNLPFAAFAGQSVRRYTYNVTNYPGIETGVQANLFVCGDQLIGGDILSLAENGFQTGLAYPQQGKT